MFHVLPIISRTDLGLSSLDSLPSRNVLVEIPTYLLAALYATVLPFAIEDNELAIEFPQSEDLQDVLWRIVYECLQREIGRPRLAVLQAALLYLHRSVQHTTKPNMHETTFTWSFLGNVVGMAHNLGLHLECRMYAIPAKERRLRRRLWWATYIEDKWLSLLLGRPPHIQHEECDVSELTESDFQAPGALVTEGYRAFQDMSRLAIISKNVQASL